MGAVKGVLGDCCAHPVLCCCCIMNAAAPKAVLHLLACCRHPQGPLGRVCACAAAWWLQQHSSPAALLQVLPVRLL